MKKILILTAFACIILSSCDKGIDFWGGVKPGHDTKSNTFNGPEVQMGYGKAHVHTSLSAKQEYRRKLG